MAKRRLSKQQQRRIASNQKNKLDSHTQSPDDTNTISARVISHHGRQLIAEIEKGQKISCNIRQNLGEITCGDYIAVQQVEETDAHPCYVVVALHARKNLLEKTGFAGVEKPVAANIDQVIIVCAILPQPNTYLIDRYLVATENLPANAVIVLNKIDLSDADNRHIAESLEFLYEKIGYPVITTSVKQHTGLDTLHHVLKNKTSILAGLSGVGKSSLVKAMLPDEDIRIGETSAASGEGKHTTTVSALYHLGHNGIIIDSPGVRDFTPVNKSITDITHGFTDIRKYSDQCKFSNCKHINEPGCAVKAAIKNSRLNLQRYNNYQRMVKEFNESNT